jgi:hypothetical protein
MRAPLATLKDTPLKISVGPKDLEREETVMRDMVSSGKYRIKSADGFYPIRAFYGWGFVIIYWLYQERSMIGKTNIHLAVHFKLERRLIFFHTGRYDFTIACKSVSSGSSFQFIS